MISSRTLVFSLTVLLLLSFAQPSNARQLQQTIKGNVYDIETQTPLTGATVVILDSNPIYGTTTDLEGNFVMSKIALGRQSLKVSYMGYEPAVIPNVMVTSGKEVVLNVGLKQSISEMEGVTVSASIRKDIPLNSMATNSARSFTVEETRRYAGGLDDPARMVSAFAGVTTGNIQDNAIIVRGNSPKGISWRLEGVEIPTPHHFPAGNVAGGGIVTVFSSQMLANSDFFTSAFPAEYGNATAGVFDMKLRNGNFDKREHTFQAGVLGIDLSSEGPLANGSNASYLFNYRYSTFGLLTDINVIPTNQALRYQDLSFKFNFPTKKAGVFSLWGIGGMDSMTQPEETNPELWETDWDRVTFDWDVQMGAMGLSHRFIIGRKTYIGSIIAATGLKNKNVTFRLDDDLELRPDLHASDNSGKVSFGSYINHKFSPRHTNKTGANYKILLYTLDINSTQENRPETFRNNVDENGSSNAVEFYSQSKYDLSESVTLNAGVNASYFGVNKEWSVDPRFGLRWGINNRHALSVGYGKHSQMEDLKIYFINPEPSVQPNKNLELSQAHHLVLGYDWKITGNHRLMVEAYYQRINDAPGIADSSYSLINFKQDWFFNSILENNSSGKNAGIDVTFERFLNKNYYYLITGSLFNSRYKGDDGVWRDTRFNKGFVVNGLFGKEFFFQENNKVLGLNSRFTYVGGERYSPLLIEESREEKREIFDETRAFEEQLPSTFTVDFTVTYRNNHRNYSGVWALQVKNLLGANMYHGRYYNLRDDEFQMDKEVVIVPSLSYKVEF